METDYKKLYKDALERARNIRFGDPNSATANVVCEEIFPELRESEDERIRKALIRALKNLDKDHYNMIYLDGFSIQQCLAWLEKQGEHNPAWSEEEEKIIETMCKEGDLKPSEMQWLKSLKNRV